MANIWEVLKNIFKALYVVVFAFFESITVSFYQNIKKRWKGPSNEFKQVKVPKGYKKKEPVADYKEIPSTPPNKGFNMFG